MSTAASATELATESPALAITEAIPTIIGTPFGSGFYAGRYQVDGKSFALIFSGAAGELRGKWNDALTMVAGAHHRADGMANTEAMASAGSALAQAALALKINGLSDWYLPSRDELEMGYRAFKPTGEENYACDDGANPSSLPPGEDYTEESPEQTTVANFREGGADALDDAWYWSSTQHASDPSDAWGQDFDDGSQLCNHTSNQGRARAVRRLPI
jgi:hypothetical protein